MAHPFRVAVEARRHDGMVATLAQDVVFHSPVVHSPYQGAVAVSRLLAAVMAVVSDFRYTDEIATGDTTALIFRARIGEKELEGIDILRHNEAGQVADFTVMVRPLSGLLALAEAMKLRLEVSRPDSNGSTAVE